MRWAPVNATNDLEQLPCRCVVRGSIPHAPSALASKKVPREWAVVVEEAIPRPLMRQEKLNDGVSSCLANGVGCSSRRVPATEEHQARRGVAFEVLAAQARFEVRLSTAPDRVLVLGIGIRSTCRLAAAGAASLPSSSSTLTSTSAAVADAAPPASTSATAVIAVDAAITTAGPAAATTAVAPAAATTTMLLVGPRAVVLHSRENEARDRGQEICLGLGLQPVGTGRLAKRPHLLPIWGRVAENRVAGEDGALASRTFQRHLQTVLHRDAT